MDAIPRTSLPVCRACGEPLAGAQGKPGRRLCLRCLLEAGVDREDSIVTVPAPEDPLPARFAHYEIVADSDAHPSELGRGAMGITYRATDLTLRCAVALKVINLELAAHPRARARFLREARAAAGLRHPHVASVFFFGERSGDGQPFYAMELVEGETLQARVQRTGGLPVEAVLEIGAQVADALEAAGARGLMHRDLKPANLMLAAGETINVKLIDFGLAKAMAAESRDLADPHRTRPEEFVGTPAFASPEQFDGEPGIDARSDFYALGATLWYALTGRAPFTGRNLAEIHDHQVYDALPLGHLKVLRVPLPLVELLRSLLCSDPAGRPATARGLATAFRRCRQAPVDAAPRRLTRWMPGVGALLILSAFAGVLWFPWRRHTTVQAEAVAVPAPEKSIAVLPFQPLVADHRDQALEMGMADTLISKLSNGQVVVRSLASVRKYDNLEQNPQIAGRELQVRTVLEGNVQKQDNRIRVTARLINVADGVALWSGSFDERFTDVFAVQDAISEKVVNAMALRLSENEKQRMARRYTDNVEAYQLYLLGRYHFSKLTPPEVRAGIGYFQQVIALDPHYALAYFGLADAYRALTITGDQRPHEYLPQAKAAAMKALEIDESMAEPHAILAFIHFWYDWDWPGAEREAKRAIALNPNSAFAHLAYAHWLSLVGRGPEAVAEGAAAVKLDPLSLMTNALEGSFLHFDGRNDEARTQLQKTLELDPGFWIAHLYLGKILVQQGKYAQASAELAKARETSHGNSLTISVRGYAAALTGDAAKAQAVLDELQSVSTHRYIPPQTIALIYAGLGQSDQAFLWLDKAFDEHDVHLSYLKADPQWTPLHPDPRFAALLQRIGLP